MNIEYFDLGVCVVISDGAGGWVGISHDQLERLAEAGEVERARLQAQWRDEAKERRR